MNSLTIIVDGYISKDSIFLKNMESYYKTLSFEKAIEYASFGRDENRAINPHQYRVGKDKCKSASQKLNIQAIAQANTFEEIFAQTEKVRISTHRIGDLWSYDTALRIGFNLNIYPTTVYLQSGAKKGASHLIKRRLNRSEPVEVFPVEFHSLKPHQIENLLCIYESSLYKLKK